MFVGEIVEVFESQTNIMYKIDDRTGPPIEVRRWINAEEVRVEKGLILSLLFKGFTN